MSIQPIPSRQALFSSSEKVCDFAEALTHDEYLIVDVRTPREFSDGSLPNAINIPIFENDERHLIGTIYRQQGKESAILQGLQLVEPRLHSFLNQFADLPGKKLAVMCARGGMRSLSVVNLLCKNGFKAVQLAGGYKNFRQFTLAQFEQFSRPCIVLHGLTGTGKTRLLHLLSPALDIEEYAQHQSSIFGGLNRQPRSQKWFDSYLLQAILALPHGSCFVEGESRQISNIFLPPGIAQAMRQGICVHVEASIETRIKRILEDYPVEDEATFTQIEKLLRSLQMKLGSETVATLLHLLHADRLADLVQILLTEYYDKRYGHSLAKHQYQLTISSENLFEAAKQLQFFREFLLSGNASLP